MWVCGFDLCYKYIWYLVFVGLWLRVSAGGVIFKSSAFPDGGAAQVRRAWRYAFPYARQCNMSTSECGAVVRDRASCGDHHGDNDAVWLDARFRGAARKGAFRDGGHILNWLCCAGCCGWPLLYLLFDETLFHLNLYVIDFIGSYRYMHSAGPRMPCCVIC